jgi:peptidyl-prolyl cis-trans isomerase SurA
MRKFSALWFFSTLILSHLSAQYSPNETFLTVGNRKISADEFERIYSKNFAVNSTEKQSVEDYYTLFLNFELKVSAALDARLDTLKSFKQELKTYRDQLAKSYLTDNETIDKFVREAYSRMQTEVNVSHIMVMVPQNSSPADTLKAYHKISDIRKRLLSGESFEKLAVELSEDPSAKSNLGNLGYFSVFRMVYSFENAAYNTKTGEISQPVRTQFGYHLIKVLGTRQSAGEIKVAHIMVAVPQDAAASKWNEAREKIFKISDRLTKGEDFGALARELSDDQNSGRNNGELPLFTSGQMVPEFEIPAFALKNPGDISQPVKTSFGWHIIKLIEKQGVKPFDQVKNELKSKVMRDERAVITSNSFVTKLKKKYSYKEFPKNLVCFYGIDSTIYKGNINFKNQCDLTNSVLRIDKEDYSGNDFLQFLKTIPPPAGNTPISNYINQSFNKFKDKTFLSYEDVNLEKNYPDFHHLVGEYHDGILLFNIMEDQVWGKASKDTVGLQNYYTTTWVTGKTDPKPLSEVKGLVTADYQNYLEEKWIDALKNKYKVTVNQELLHKIADKYKFKK